MSYSVTNIIPVSLILTPAGLSPANFNTAMIIAPVGELETSSSLTAGDTKDYASTDEVLKDFTSDSVADLASTRWFANIPTPPKITVYVWDDVNDSVTTAAADAVDKAWRYWLFFPQSTTSTESDITDLADWADGNGHFVSFVIDNVDAKDSGISTDLGSVLSDRGNRHIFIGYRESQTITDDASQAYANAQTAAAFQKFNPDGARTAITAEFQVLPGVVGESLQTSAYSALNDKNIVYWSEIELQGSVDESRTLNTKTSSSFNEYIDDVFNLDVLKNRIQVAGYNYLANAGTKRPLTPRGYAGLLNRVEEVLKQFYNNGVLGQAEYTNPITGETELAKFGYALFSSPEDVLDLTSSERANREYPPIRALAILARAGHQADITINVE
jgi:hypothetical protein